MFTRAFPRRARQCLSRRLILTALGAALSAASLPALAQPPRVLPPGETPRDVRLHAPKDLDGYFPFVPAKSPSEWATRAERLRRQMLVSLDLWPMPERTPLNAVIHGRMDRGDYTVEKVYFESHPGFYVTGNLYRPKDLTGRAPGVLCPHGHWANGRFYDEGAEGVRREIALGGERFEEGGRSPLQSRCVQLARMGCVVFHYDMIGYADSQQIGEAVAHRLSEQRPDMNTVTNWGLFSPQAETHLQSVMGLQTWSSLRALDFLMGLPDVDTGRIGVTGASGGGTQTFILGALDSRPTVLFPAVMVGTAMQGGCTCENASLLRVDTGNVEFAGLIAPRPLGMTAADDWTKDMPTKGFPELKRHYAMLGVPDRVTLKPLLHFGHNYNAVSRVAMYNWFNQHLKLGGKEPIIERDYARLTASELSVFDTHHSPPAGGPDFERKLLRYLTATAERQVRAARESIEAYRELVGRAVEVLIGRTWAEVGEVEFQPAASADREGCRETVGLLRLPARGEELPVLVLQAATAKNRTVVWVTEKGKAGLYEGDGLAEPVRKLLAAGVTVIGVDLLYQGEFLTNGQAVTKARRVKNPREFAGYTYGYNHSLFAQRAQDILTVVKFAKARGSGSESVSLAGVDGAGPWVAAALPLVREAIASAAVDTAGFRFGQLTDLWDVRLLPGGAKYDDLPGFLALAAPTRLWLAGEGDQAPEAVKALYAKANASAGVTLFAGGRAETASAAARWLTEVAP